MRRRRYTVEFATTRYGFVDVYNVVASDGASAILVALAHLSSAEREDVKIDENFAPYASRQQYHRPPARDRHYYLPDTGEPLE